MKSIDYAITLTSTRFVKKFSTSQQYVLMYDAIHVIKKATPELKLSIIHELTQNDDVHFHGIFRYEGKQLPRDIPIYVRNLFRDNKYFGFLCIKPIEDYTKWYEYLIKDFQSTYKRSGIYPIVLNELMNLVDEKTCFYNRLDL